jgi:hypothetical protein
MECVPPVHQPRHSGLTDGNSESLQQLSSAGAHCPHLNGESQIGEFKHEIKWVTNKLRGHGPQANYTTGYISKLRFNL